MSATNNPPQGVYAALVTAFHADGSIDLEKTAALADWLIAQGVHGLAPLGSTGEFYAMNMAERQAVAASVLDVAAGRVPVIVGTNASSTADVIAYSQLAEKQGAAGILLAPPFYSLPTHQELIQHYKTVAANTNLPITLYNYPGRTGIDLTVDIVAELAEIESVVAIKESSGDATRISALQEVCGDRIAVLCGCDTLALESFAGGATGWIGGGVNFLPREHLALFDAVAQQHDLVKGRRIANSLTPVLRLLEDGGAYTQLVKAGLDLVGHPAGPPRPPLLPASVSDTEALQQAMKKLETSAHA